MGNFQTSSKSHFWSFLEIQRRLDVHGGGYVFYQNIEMHYGVLGFRENMADDVQVMVPDREQLFTPWKQRKVILLLFVNRGGKISVF